MDYRHILLPKDPGNGESKQMQDWYAENFPCTKCLKEKEVRTRGHRFVRVEHHGRSMLLCFECINTFIAPNCRDNNIKYEAVTSYEEFTLPEK